MTSSVVGCEVVSSEAGKPPEAPEKLSEKLRRSRSKDRRSTPRERWDRHRLGTIDDVRARSGMGRTFILGEIKKGRLVARKAGRRTLIGWEDYEDWWNKLPFAGSTNSPL